MMIHPDAVVSLNGINERYYFISSDYLRFPYVSRYQQDIFRSLTCTALRDKTTLKRYGELVQMFLPNAQELFFTPLRKVRTVLTGGDPAKKPFQPTDFEMYFGFDNAGPDALPP